LCGDGHAVRVAAHIVEDLLRAGEGRCGVDHPLGLSCRGQILHKCLPIGEGVKRPEEVQLVGGEGGVERLEQQPPEEAREHAHGEEEPRSARDPPRTVEREAAAREDTVQMGMVHQRLPPPLDRLGVA